MKFRDLTELAWRNLREALLRNSLTTLGIGVGVASLVAMLSLGVGLQEIGQSAALALGPVRRHHRRAPRQFPRLWSRRRRTIRSAAPAGPLDEDARRALERLPNVVEVYPEIRFPTEIRYAGTPYSTIVAGVPESARRSGAYDGMTGAFFSGPAADEAILQIEFARQLSPQPNSLLGKDLVLRYAERQALAGASPKPPIQVQIRVARTILAFPADFPWFRARRSCASWESSKPSPPAVLAAWDAAACSFPCKLPRNCASRRPTISGPCSALVPAGTPIRALTVRVKSPALGEGCRGLDQAHGLRHILST